MPDYILNRGLFHESVLAEKVRACTTFTQLLRVALFADEANHPTRKGLYCSGYRFMSGNELKWRLDAVRSGERPLRFVTRNYGFREMAGHLLRLEAEQKSRKVA